MPNENVLEGCRCPKCGNEGPFNIDVILTMRVHDDGTEELYGDLEWDEESNASCPICRLTTKFGTFVVGGESDSTQPTV